MPLMMRINTGLYSLRESKYKLTITGDKEGQTPPTGEYSNLDSFWFGNRTAPDYWESQGDQVWVMVFERSVTKGDKSMKNKIKSKWFICELESFDITPTTCCLSLSNYKLVSHEILEKNYNRKISKLRWVELIDEKIEPGYASGDIIITGKKFKLKYAWGGLNIDGENFNDRETFSVKIEGRGCEKFILDLSHKINEEEKHSHCLFTLMEMPYSQDIIPCRTSRVVKKRNQSFFEKMFKRRDMKRKIVCLCGSTRFKKEYEKVTLEETLAGNIVLSVGCFVHSDNISITEEQKQELDKLHLDKIKMADEIIVIAPNGYTGESTNREIDFASQLLKPVRYVVGK